MRAGAGARPPIGCDAEVDKLLDRMPVIAGIHAYCASPLPKDQFSFLTSTRLMTTSVALRDGRADRTT